MDRGRVLLIVNGLSVFCTFPITGGRTDQDRGTQTLDIEKLFTAGVPRKTAERECSFDTAKSFRKEVLLCSARRVWTTDSLFRKTLIVPV